MVTDSTSTLDKAPRRFRFGLSSLFVVVTVAAIPCAWVGYSLNWIRERREAFERDEVGEYLETGLPPPAAPDGLWLFGEPGVETLWVDEHNAERARQLFPEAKIVPDPEAWSRLVRNRHH